MNQLARTTGLATFDDLLVFHKSVFGDLKMEGPDDPPAGSGSPPPPTPPPATSGNTFTQADITRVATREKEEGKQAAIRALQDELGVDLETAKAIVKNAKEADERSKTEAQKAADAAARAQTKAEEKEREATATAHQAQLALQFVLAGVTDEAKIGRYSKLVEVPVGAKPEEIKTAVAKLKEEEPALFGGTTPPPPAGNGGRPPAPNSDPKGNPPAQTQSDDAYKRGLDLAKGRTSMWGGVMPGQLQKQ